ncbi:LOW QUALITY PROTEIN: hypothetical protein PanWU01x14_267020 [Parasponia andersonii]|uniref:Uncharacterized protein n=1 Tax=Parasponia andersonii TaxID=3476 RepID=A0A2P5B6P2_PARAD|nr:LOW QUALITY PROTEIN: hypothetical protein PanWU01x14_267020 [Parasponia andersonii]
MKMRKKKSNSVVTNILSIITNDWLLIFT